MDSRRPRPKSLALPSTSTLPYSMTTPPSILKSRSGMSDRDDELLGRSSALPPFQGRLEDEASAYRRRLETYRQAQHQQALLVARLQTKLLQYRQRCSDLETKLSQEPGQELLYGSPTGIGPEIGRKGASTDLEDALWRLEQERIRNDNLMQLNSTLRSELEDTRQVNDTLSADLQKLSDDWEKLTKQMGEKEQLWKAEEQAYCDFYASEHSRLLDLWKKVSAAKRDFAEMKSSTGRDMAQLKNIIGRLSNEISSCVLTAAVSAPTPQQEAQQSSIIAHLSQENQLSQSSQDSLRKQLKERNDKISELDKSLGEAQSKVQSLELTLNRIETQELGRLGNCLQEIAKLLLNDFDQYGLEDGHDLHLSSTPAIFVFDENGENPVVFGESVVSAVQAALNKKQLQIHQLQVNLSSSKEQSALVRGHVESLETDLSKAEEKVTQLSEENERIKDTLESLKMEKDSTVRSLDSVRNEKNILEQQRKSIAAELESTLKTKSTMAATLSKLEKSVETSREEVQILHSELERIRDELGAATTKLKLEQDLNIRIREQLTFIGDDKEKNASENKSLKTQQNELVTKYEDLVFQFERSEDSLKKWKMDAEILNDKLRSTTERVESAEKDKKKATERVKEMETAKTKLESDLQDSRNDLNSLRREALNYERIKSDLEGRIETLISQLDASENQKSIFESQLASQRDEYIREMGLLGERVDMLTEELNQARRDYEELMQTLERTRADLSNQEKLHMEAVHFIEDKESLLKNLTNALEKLRDEKLSLEELEHNLKTALIEKDKKIDILDKQLTDIKTKMNLEVGTLKEKLSSTEKDSRALMEKAEKDNAANELKIKRDLENMRLTYEVKEEKLKVFYTDKLKLLQNDLEGEKKNELSKLNAEIALLKQQIDTCRIQYEEAIVRAENDKQQGLLLAQQDQQGLNDKIRLMEGEIDDLKSEKDRLKREYEAKCSHEKSAASTLRSEVNKLKNELDACRQLELSSQKQIEARIAEIEGEREIALMQTEDLRNKLRNAEERESELKRELNEVLRKLKDMEASGDHCRKELAETRRSLTELAVEKDKSNSTLEQTKDEVNRKNNEVFSLKKDLTKVQNTVKKLEALKATLEEEIVAQNAKLDVAVRDKLESSKKLEEYSDQISNYKNIIQKVQSEVTDLKLKLDGESERREDAESRYRAANKMLDEVEGRLNSTKNEEERLAGRLAELEEKYGSRESQLVQLCDDHKHREKKLLEEKHNLNVCLVSVQQQMEQLGNKLAKAEDRLHSLTEEKSSLEAKKKEAEAKLTQLQSGFKRLGLSHVAIDNPEAARRIMSTLQAQMASYQQERDTISSQLTAAKDNINSLEANKAQLQDQLVQLTRNFQNSKNDVKGKENLLFQLEKDLALKNSEIGRFTDKIGELEDNLKAKDEIIRTIRSEKETQKEELDRARQRWEENRAQNDSKWTKAEVQIRSLEGDLNRLSMVLQQKELHIQSLESKYAGNQKNMNELEQRCSSLTMTVEQLNISNEKISQAERDWKEKYNSASRIAGENATHLNQLNEKLRALQREKAMLEQERNGLNEKWESSSAALQDLKRQVQGLADKNQKLRQQTEEMTRAAIEKQLKMTLAESGKEDLRQILGDKLELQRKVDSLHDKVRDLERENRELERIRDSIPIKGGRQMPIVRDNAISVLEDENLELRRKISKMDSEIRDLERRHVKNIGEITTQVKQERDFELERARAAKLQAERLLEARESNYRQQVHRLEQQVSNLKEQLAEEIKRRQSFLSRSFRTGQEIRSLRSALGDSLRNVSLDPSPTTMENETRRLEVDLHKSTSQSSLLSPMRDTASPRFGLRSTSPVPK